MSHYDKPWLDEDTTPNWEKKKKEKERLLQEWAEDAAKHHGYKSIVDILRQDVCTEEEIDNLFSNNREDKFDNVTKPKHYNSDLSGVEPIIITEHMSFCLGNVIKYVMRSKYKGKELEDLKKALWYLNREIERIEHGKSD